MMTILVLLCVVLLVVLILSRTGGRGPDREGGRPLIARFPATIRRFPFVMVASVVVTAAGSCLVEHSAYAIICKKGLAVALLTLPLLFCSGILAERRGEKGFRPDPLSMAIAGTAILYFFLLGDFSAYSAIYRHMLWTAAAYLLVLLIPFYRASEEEEYWHYEASLAFGFAIAVIWAFALFAGISAAFAGIDYLLAVKVPAEAYLRLWIVMAGFVGVAIFLAAVPADLGEVRNSAPQSKLLDGFIRFILVPLVVLYLVILYVYAGKIILQGSWPKGGVAGFILGFSGVGIVAYQLTYGFAGTATATLQARFRKYFFPCVLPLTVVLFLSVWRRISEYGVTETRYFGVTAALWLAAVSLYYIFSRKKDLRVLPASVCLVLLLASFGPWGALSISAHSQVARLKGLLEQSGLLANETLQPTKTPAKAGALAEINTTIAYLHKIGHVQALTAWSGGKIAAGDTPEKIAAKIGIPYTLYSEERGTYFSYNVKQVEGAEIAGFRHIWELELYSNGSGDGSEEWQITDDRRVLRVKPEDGLRQLRVIGPEGVPEPGLVDLAAFAGVLLEEFPKSTYNSALPAARLVIDLPRGNERLRFVINEISGTVVDGKPQVHHIKVFMLWSGK